MPADFPAFFRAATGGHAPPYDYQSRLADDCACQSRLIEIPIPQLLDKTTITPRP
jgi:hypothetical protein